MFPKISNVNTHTHTQIQRITHSKTQICTQNGFQVSVYYGGGGVLSREITWMWGVLVFFPPDHPNMMIT